MPIELNKAEQKLAHLLKMGGAEIPEDDKGSEEEARSAARKAAKLIQQNNYSVIDAKEYDAWWESQIEERLKDDTLLQGQVESLRRELQDARQQAQSDIRAVADLVTKAQHKEMEARRQVEECQRRSNQHARELQELRSRAADSKELARVQSRADALERDLQAARQDVLACSVFVKNARDAEAQARRAEADTKKQIEACSNLVTRLKSESSATVPELVPLRQQVKDLTAKVISGSPSISKDLAYTVAAGLLAGGVVTVVGVVILQKLMEPDEPATPPMPPPVPSPPTSKPSPKPPGVHIAPKRSPGT
jgi:hypothetical protein